MNIDGIAVLTGRDINRPHLKPKIFYCYFDADKLVGLNWGENQSSKINQARYRANAQWWGYWRFPKGVDKFLTQWRAREPDWQTVKLPATPAGNTFVECQIDRKRVLLLKLPVPAELNLQDFESDRYLRLTTSQGNWLLISCEEKVEWILPQLTKGGAIRVEHLLDFNCESKVKVEGDNFVFKVTCDLHNPRHYSLKPDQKYHKVERGGNYYKVPIEWNGVIPVTRKSWPQIKQMMDSAGLEWQGVDPGQEVERAAQGSPLGVPGWTDAAPNGHLFHKYQKEGIQFCMKRGMRALVGDEMGIGKTAQAIGASIATGARSVLVVCPANARYVWEKEIQGWAGTQAIQHITTGLTPLIDAEWRIVTYDLLVARPISWLVEDRNEFDLLLGVLGKRHVGITAQFPLKIPIYSPVDATPQFASLAKQRKWITAMRRLRNELLSNLRGAGHDLLIVDEAHRAKNESAKRSESVGILSDAIPHVLLLTGTPMRNHPREASVLLGYLDPQSRALLIKEKGYSMEDIQDCLDFLMIRRLKTEVLPQLPEKIRQTVELDSLDPECMSEYYAMRNYASECYSKIIKAGGSAAQAREAMRPGIEKARTYLGLAKVRGGQVMETVRDVVEAKSNVVVFCAHHICSDELKMQLSKAGITSEIVDGRTDQIDRQRIVEDFQKGKLQCFIGGINAAGESITLTAADTVIFAELDWVPAAMLQAEDRIHRVGQKRGCHIIHLTARFSMDRDMMETLKWKLDGINQILREHGKVFADAENRECLNCVIDSILSESAKKTNN